MIRRCLGFLLLVLCSWPAVLLQAQDIDVKHYRFELSLRDVDDTIQGKASIRIFFRQNTDSMQLDFATVSGSTGMTVDNIEMEEDAAGEISFYRNFRQTKGVDASTLDIYFKKQIPAGTEKNLVISYHGIPKDGLIISRNKHGDRTFFSDNWPNRAHFWIPCVDRPDDKASCEFLVTAPAGYDVISNGIKKEERLLSGNRKLTHWMEEKAIPTKVMVIGVARFSYKVYDDSPPGIPVSAWIYPQQSLQGFADYDAAPRILKFMQAYIDDPYPFKKLANVQSTTMFGGMENASAIFYAENSITGKRLVEDLLAHEIAHQWFGNMASEKSFSHLWLSEGFATYLTNLYLESQYGRNKLKQRMLEDRSAVRDFVKGNKRPIVDSLSNYMELLNANSYQKGSWVLHMLRLEVGDSLFRQVIRTYYDSFKGGNATSRDFEQVASAVSGKDLAWFFEQWLYRSDIPLLKISKTVVGQNIVLRIEQKQEQLYKFRLRVEVLTPGTKGRTTQVEVSERVRTITLRPRNAKITIDPDGELLYAEVK